MSCPTACVIVSMFATTLTVQEVDPRLVTKGIGYADPKVAKPGDTVEIYILGKPHKAKILSDPPFDPAGHRLRDVKPVMEGAA